MKLFTEILLFFPDLTISPETTITEVTSGRFFSEEDEIKEATKMASSFVAGVMATAVADYIKAIYDDNLDNNHDNTRMVSAAQVCLHFSLNIFSFTSPFLYSILLSKISFAK